MYTEAAADLRAQPRKLDEAMKAQLRREIPKTTPVEIIAVMGDQEAFQFAEEVFDFLKYDGFNAGNLKEAFVGVAVVGQKIIRATTPWKLIIGSRP